MKASIAKFFVLGLPLLLLASPAPLNAQVLIDSGFGSSNGFQSIGLGPSGGSGTNALTVGNNSGRMLVAVVHAREASTTGLTVTDLSYGGTNFTLLEAGLRTDGSDRLWTSFYYLLNPPTGTSNLTYNITGLDRGVGISVFSLYDTDGNAPAVFGTSGGNTNSSSTVSGTTTSNNAFVITALTLKDPGNTISVNGTGQTTWFTDFRPALPDTQNTRIKAAAGYETIPTAGADSFSWSWAGGTTTSPQFSHVAVAIAAIPEPGTAALLVGGLGALAVAIRRLH